MKRKMIAAAAVVMTVISGMQVFAAGSGEYTSAGSDDIWVKASEIVKASSGILPEEKKIVWEELSPSGDTVSSEVLTIWYDENDSMAIDNASGNLVKGKALALSYAGSSDALMKRLSVNNSLGTTPFDSYADTKINNTGITETVNGNECTVYEYVMYCPASSLEYSFEKSLGLSVSDVDSSTTDAYAKLSGRVWLDDEGIMRKLELNNNNSDISYTETVTYSFDGKQLYATGAVLEGTISSSENGFEVQTAFRSTEDMSGYWLPENYRS